MKTMLSIRLETTAQQNGRLLQLQQLFADACNALAPVVQQSRCWNRVALHHLAYRSLREQFPTLGSQMVCNALYSVCRASRLVYQHPHSPFNLQRLAGAPLPCLRFMPDAPVYFDRHTLSIKAGQASMYTLDGRMRFNLPLAASDHQRFLVGKLREIVLRCAETGYALTFCFADEAGAGTASGVPQPADPTTSEASAADVADVADLSELPQYLLVLDGAASSSSPPEPAPDWNTPALLKAASIRATAPSRSQPASYRVRRTA